LQRLGLLNRHENQVGKFVPDPVGLKFAAARGQKAAATCSEDHAA
jgi:hypothetical protein